mgnify:FL=1|jgi:hypothetical protein
MMEVSNSKGYSVKFVSIQEILDFFGDEEGTSIITDNHSEYTLSLFGRGLIDYIEYNRSDSYNKRF